MLGWLLSMVLAAGGQAQAANDDVFVASKKQAYLASKQHRHRARRRRAPQRAEQVVYAHNLRTHEIMPLTGPDVEASDYDTFFRCWFTHRHGDIPDALVAVILEAATHFDVRAIHVISGYRHPKYNRMLRKKGRQVARNSKHTQARAIDFFLPGVATRTLYDWLLEHHEGGVGFYPASEFVHVDDGRKRTWRGT